MSRVYFNPLYAVTLMYVPKIVRIVRNKYTRMSKLKGSGRKAKMYVNVAAADGAINARDRPVRNCAS